MKYFDCEYCPLSWEDRSYEGDYDCGCLAYGDYSDGEKFICLLPKYIKRKIADFKQRKIDQELSKEYDRLCEWHKELLEEGEED